MYKKVQNEKELITQLNNNFKSKRMRNRFSKWSRHSSRMACLLAACGLMYACQDEFLLDDEKPEWLNSSIYQSLVERGNFSTYLKLLADKDVNPDNVRPLTDVLDRTGSKTVFVADDDAWKAFFEKNATLPESNPWHYATSYEKLSKAQKKLLIHTSMLNNSIVMENLASSEGANNSRPIRGEYMRRYTDVEVTDSVAFLASNELPYSYNKNEKDYWARFREQPVDEENPVEGLTQTGKGIYLVNDETEPMMLHFTSEHMAKNTVNDKDFSYFMGRERITSDVHIYDAKLIEKDAVCENGYVNVTEKPLVPLASMAEIIRTNGNTNIFSHMLDRFSAPFYNSTITRMYEILYPEFEERGDSIFTKKYFSKLGLRPNSGSKGVIDTEPGPNGTLVEYSPYITKQDDITAEGSEDIGAYLKFDPGWNGYNADAAVEKDMAAMFVPSDAAMWRYFLHGGGQQLIETYGDPTMTYETEDDLYRNIDQIPLGTIQSLINLIMQRSFVGSVPSKMTKLRDDAQEQLFYAKDIDLIDTCILASNGAVYIMDDVYGPADFTSVTSPAYISKTNRVIKWAIYDESKMGLNYYAYLKAMQSEFTFLLPSDSAMLYYYDPVSFKSSNCCRVVEFAFNSSLPKTVCKQYVPATGEIKNKLVGANASMVEGEITNRLKDILESHTIVHDGTNPIDGEDEYFRSKNGTPLKVVRNSEGKIEAVLGGLQLENQRQGLVSENPGIELCKVTRAYEECKNGQTYILNSPIIPTYRSVYSILTREYESKKEAEEGGEEVDEYAKNPYLRFYELCKSDDYKDIIIGCGLVDENLKESEKNAAMKKYLIFFDDKGLDYNIQFFSNYHYTAFIPTNEAIEEAIANGLPTWEEIKADYDSNRKIIWDEITEDSVASDSLRTTEDSLRIQAKISYLTNFIRYHFADNSVFTDRTEMPETEMVTGSYDSDKGLFCKLYIDRKKDGEYAVLRVRDGNEGSQMIPTVGERNILARDVSCTVKPTSLMSKVTLEASSSCVIHSIDGVLNHTELVDGKHNIVWETPEQAKKYLKRYGTLLNFDHHE